MTAGSLRRPSPFRICNGQSSLAPPSRAEAVLEARRVLRVERVLLRPLASTGLRPGVNKISLDVLEYNTRALRTYERLGFQREGVHREDIYKDGRFVNVMRMSILARELQEGPLT